jgi:hypothetical protein
MRTLQGYKVMAGIDNNQNASTFYGAKNLLGTMRQITQPVQHTESLKCWVKTQLTRMCKLVTDCGIFSIAILILALRGISGKETTGTDGKVLC